MSQRMSEGGSVDSIMLNPQHSYGQQEQELREASIGVGVLGQIARTIYVSKDMTREQVEELIKRHSEEQPFQLIGPEDTRTPGMVEYTVRSSTHMDSARTNKERDIVQDIMSMSAAYK